MTGPTLDRRQASRDSRAQRAWSGVALVLLAHAPGCATIGEKRGPTEVVTLRSYELEDRKDSYLVLATRTTSTMVEVRATEACERHRVSDKEEVQSYEDTNENVGTDVVLALVGAGFVGAGLALYADTASTPASAPNERFFTQLPQDGAYVVSALSMSAGGIMMLVPLIDGFRALGGRETRRAFTENGPTTVATKACGNVVVPQGVVEVPSVGSDVPKLDLSFDGDRRPWMWSGVGGGSTSNFALDLAAVVPDEVLRRSPRPISVRVGMNNVTLATFETGPLFTVADDRAWASLALARQRCLEPDSVDDCDELRRYGASYPSSRHAPAVRGLLANAEGVFKRLRDDEAYASAGPQRCAAAETEDACDALKHYLQVAPTGAHADAARATLAIGEVKVAKLVAAREAAQRVEAARQAAEEARQRAEEEAEERRQREAEEAEARREREAEEAEARREREAEQRELARRRAAEARERARRSGGSSTPPTGR
jgi:hypothetical protein